MKRLIKTVSVIMVSLLFVHISTYALPPTETNFTFDYGNLDFEEGITTGDALLALKYSVGLTELNDNQALLADVDGDSKITTGDALLILKYSVGLLDEFPINQINRTTAKKVLDVNHISQVGKYPTGCESVSAVMAANYAGIKITPENFIDKYLDKGSTPKTKSSGKLVGPSPWEKFIGSPYSSSAYGCYAPVIANALNKFVDKDKYTVYELYNVDFDDLCKAYIDRSIPVIVWATMSMSKTYNSKSWYIDTTGEKFTWRKNEHCLLLTGYDSSGYYFNDPLEGKNKHYSKSSVKAAYNSMYSMVVVIMERP